MENKHAFDLEDRTTEFAKRVVRLCTSLPKNSINNRLTGQAVGSAVLLGQITEKQMMPWEGRIL